MAVPQQSPRQDYLHKHVLVCTDDSCGAQGGADVREALKKELRARDLRKIYREGTCSCTGLCGVGVNAVIWPEGTYLSGLTVADVPRLVDFLAGTGPRLQAYEDAASEKIRIKKSSS